MATRTVTPTTKTGRANGRDNGRAGFSPEETAARRRDFEYPKLGPNGIPPLHELDREYVNEIYPPKADPMPDGKDHWLSYFKLIELLRRALEMTRAAAITLGDIYIYYIDKYGWRSKIAPDAFVILNAKLDEMDVDQSYFIELMTDKVPNLVAEVGSPSTYKRDLEEKREIYAFIGIPEYWLFDPSGGRYYGAPLIGLRLVDGEYEEIEIEELRDGSLRGRSEELGIDLYWMDNTLRLRVSATGEWVETPTELAVRADALATRADAAEARAAEAETENAKLREQLRQLRERD